MNTIHATEQIMIDMDTVSTVNDAATLTVWFLLCMRDCNNVSCYTQTIFIDSAHNGQQPQQDSERN